MQRILEVGKDDWSKYGILRLRYLHEHKREMYRELLLTGKLAQHCKAIDKAAFEQSEQIQAIVLIIPSGMLSKSIMYSAM